MLTLFTSPRSFVEPPFGSMQRNAIGSWLALQPPPQIVLFGNDDGVAEVAREFALLHVPDVESDRRGAPMRSAMCELAGRVAKHDLLCSINADIIILDGFVQAVERLLSDPDPRLGRGFVAAGRRHNLDVDWEVDFADPDWRTLLRDCVRRKGELFIPSAMDYFIYPKSASPSARLSFPGEAPGWDPWFLHQFQRQGLPIIDLTPIVSVVHQNHETAAELAAKRRKWARDAAAMARLRQAGGFSSMATLRDADLVLSAAGFERPQWPGRMLSRLSKHKAWRRVLGAKRELQMWLRRC